MRYINKLQEENEALKDTLKTVEQELTDILVYLASKKFQGPLNNYVNSDEIYSRIMSIRGAAQK